MRGTAAIRSDHDSPKYSSDTFDWPRLRASGAIFLVTRHTSLVTRHATYLVAQHSLRIHPRHRKRIDDDLVQDSRGECAFRESKRQRERRVCERPLEVRDAYA